MTGKILLIYKSKTGFTKRYAEMIAKETNVTLMDYKEASPEKISAFDTVIFGSRAFAGTIDGYKKMQDMLSKSTVKKFILFATGATPNTATDTINEFWAQNLSAAELQRIPHFYMPGGLCLEKLPISDRLMLKAAGAMMKKKKNKTEQDIAFEQAIKTSYDISSKEFIQPLLDFLAD